MADYVSLNKGFYFMIVITLSMIIFAFYGGMLIDQAMWEEEGLEHGDEATYTEMGRSAPFFVNLYYAFCLGAVALAWWIFLQSAHKRGSGSRYQG